MESGSGPHFPQVRNSRARRSPRRTGKMTARSSQDSVPGFAMKQVKVTSSREPEITSTSEDPQEKRYHSRMRHALQPGSVTRTFQARGALAQSPLAGGAEAASGSSTSSVGAQGLWPSTMSA